MAFDVDEMSDAPRLPDPNMIPSRLQFLFRSEAAWIANGGVAANGIKYDAPSRAIAWGKEGCPLLPREAREGLKGSNLPKSLEQFFGTPLTVDQLDEEVLKRLDITKLPISASNAFTNFLYSLPRKVDEVAIPAGIPLAWFERLPLSGRTRSAVQRAFQLEHGTESFLSVPMLAQEFLSVRSVGSATLNELMCVVESVELERSAEDLVSEQETAMSPHGPTEYEADVNEAALQFLGGMTSFTGRLYGFARWAMAETGAETFRGAIAEIKGAPEENEIWDALASVNLSDLAAPAPHPYEVLDTWLKGMDSRKRSVFLTRVSECAPNVLTLEELGAQFGVTRERVRQIEVRIRRSLNEFP